MYIRFHVFRWLNSSPAFCFCEVRVRRRHPAVFAADTMHVIVLGERMHSMGKWFKCNLLCARWDEMSSTKQHHPVKRLLSFWVSAADCSVQIHLSCNYHLMVESPFICCNITSHASRVASPPCCCYEHVFSSATFKRVIFCFLFLVCLKGCFILLICNVYYVLVKVLNSTSHFLLPHPLM